MTSNMVDAAPVREHLRRLIADDMTQAAIVRRSGVSAATVSSLLHGAFAPGRPQQETIQALTADRLLAVDYELPQRRPGVEPMCAPGERFEPAGYRVGRCTDCGQLAQIRTTSRHDVGNLQLVAHPRREPDGEQTPQPLIKASRGDKCGAPAGHARHVRAGEDPCDLCKAARNGYELGKKARTIGQPPPVPPRLPDEVTEALLRLCRAIVLGRPPRGIRELAARALRASTSRHPETYRGKA